MEIPAVGEAKILLLNSTTVQSNRIYKEHTCVSSGKDAIVKLCICIRDHMEKEVVEYG